MLVRSPDTRYLDYEIKNTAAHLEELKKRLPWQQFKNTKRMVCSLGSDYGYSQHVTKGHSFSLYPPLKILMDRLNAELGTNFNSALLNWYPKDEYVGIGKHSDSENELVEGQPVVSISLGDSCLFTIETWDKSESITVPLVDGDVFIMGHNCQRYYAHSIPYKKMEMDRISITFREFKV